MMFTDKSLMYENTVNLRSQKFSPQGSKRVAKVFSNRILDGFSLKLPLDARFTETSGS